ncbi:DUF4479 domain-containing protein [Bacillus carboniphilus]|uniref:DUF4479 domain-containing protein n=1 Tax=Bacillus carboniphilus TaxID=86663 RepID=A0ABY9JY36_9BACI|nr:DUF4479 family protein [Bacillus carboniphilus]WLR44302.1 DUF4479 domain-containing protein [Bacillus carboniphilus]
MNAFYNFEGVGDTLIISLKDIDKQKRTFDRKGDVVKIFHKDTNERVGYNIFNASNYIQVNEKGPVSLTENLVSKLNDLIKQSGFEDELEADLGPKFVVGFVEEKEKHPNADKLSICQVNVGKEVLQIVCGAPNVEAQQKVVVAKVGAVMPSGMIIKDAELRGVPSSGMICSAKELNLPDAPKEKGILVLNSEEEIGSPFQVNM